MRQIRIPMWRNGKKKLLWDLLKSFDIRYVEHWVLLDFSGAGITPNGASMVDFERAVRSSPSGYHFDTVGLAKFAKELSDVNELTLKGMREDRVVIEIDAIDSGAWEIAMSEDMGEDLR